MNQMILLTCKQGGVAVQVQVEAEVRGGLAIHRKEQDLQGHKWQITHVRSGLAISGPYIYQTTARQVVKDLLALADWDADDMDARLHADEKLALLAQGIVLLGHDSEKRRG